MTDPLTLDEFAAMRKEHKEKREARVKYLDDLFKKNLSP